MQTGQTWNRGLQGCRQVVNEDEMILKAVRAAKNADVAILCAGLTKISHKFQIGRWKTLTPF